ncbi:MAG: hypothetical protein QXI91_06565 [Candidatus Bathyarchaeia archaeon]
MQKTQLFQRNDIDEELIAVVKRLFNQYKYPVFVISGNPDTGKTDTALLLVEIALNANVLDHFASNVDTQGIGETITSFERAEYWFKTVKGRKCFFLDEAGIHVDTRRPLMQINVAIRHLIFVIRKFKGHFIFALQDVRDLDYWKNSELTGAFITKTRCGDQFDASFNTKFGTWYFWDIPKTNIPFNTEDISPFTLKEPLSRPNWILSDPDKAILWAWSVEGKKCSELGIHQQQLNRLVRKFVREVLVTESVRDSA